MQQLTPYIMFDGNCEKALNFYAKAFGGEIKDLMRYEGAPVESKTDDKQKVMHAHFAVNGNIIFMAADSDRSGPEETAEGKVHLSNNFTNGDEQEKVFNALSEGGQISMPLQDTFWGARFGMLMDKFGVNWMFNYDKK